MRLDNDVVIIGTGITDFGKFDRSIRSLTAEAVRLALTDANVTAQEVGMVFFGNAVGGITTGQESIRGQVALKPTGLLGKPIVNVDNACASGTTAAHLAMMAVKAGVCDVAVAVGAERLTHPDKRVTFSAFGAGVDLTTLQEEAAAAGRTDADIAASLTGGGTKSNFMDEYAAMALAYMARTGATADDFARVVVKSRGFGADNPHAQFRSPTTVADVLAARRISGPLTMPMCSPIGDGAAVVVIASRQFAQQRGAEAIGVRAAVLVSGSELESKAPERAARAVLEEAGVDPLDLDVVEVHDAAAPGELIAYEQIGLCPPGDGPKLIREGVTDRGGRVLVNPSGGLLSRGHPVGATGCAQLIELSDQLRGRAGARQQPGARLAFAHNNGGQLMIDTAVATGTIIERL